MASACANPKTAAELSLCACLKSTQDLDTALKSYEDAQNAYDTQNKLYQAYQQQYQDWSNNRGQYANFGDRINQLTNEQKTWNNCVTWDQTSAHRHDDWCQNDVGQGWTHAGQTGGGCAWGWGKGVCQRTSDYVNSIVNTEKAAVEPARVSPPQQQPNAPSNNNIQCCTQLIGSVSGNIGSVNQNCQQKITEQLAAAQGGGSSSGGSGGSSSSGGGGGSTTPVTTTSTSNSNQTFIIGGVIAVLFILILLVLLL
jgi:hypothetical protein